eukprot:scaffold1986_cov144-Skeletonema_menzelii.AAC.3
MVLPHFNLLSILNVPWESKLKVRHRHLPGWVPLGLSPYLFRCARYDSGYDGRPPPTTTSFKF